MPRVRQHSSIPSVKASDFQCYRVFRRGAAEALTRRITQGNGKTGRDARQLLRSSHSPDSDYAGTGRTGCQLQQHHVATRIKGLAVRLQAADEGVEPDPD